MPRLDVAPTRDAYLEIQRTLERVQEGQAHLGTADDRGHHPGSGCELRPAPAIALVHQGAARGVQRLADGLKDPLVHINRDFSRFFPRNINGIREFFYVFARRGYAKHHITGFVH